MHYRDPYDQRNASEDASRDRRYRKTLFLRPSGGHASYTLSASPWLPDGFSICFLTEHVQFGGVSDPLGFITLNKKKSAKNISLPRLGQHNALWWLSSSQSAKKSAKVAGTLFSLKSAKSTGILPEERLTSEVQALLNNATGAIECATGGHGRCANSRCGCRCHKSRARARSAANASRAPRQSFSPCC
jgi:hypothetical protein